MLRAAAVENVRAAVFVLSVLRAARNRSSLVYRN